MSSTRRLGLVLGLMLAGVFAVLLWIVPRRVLIGKQAPSRA